MFLITSAPCPDAPPNPSLRVFLLCDERAGPVLTYNVLKRPKHEPVGTTELSSMFSVFSDAEVQLRMYTIACGWLSDRTSENLQL